MKPSVNDCCSIAGIFVRNCCDLFWPMLHARQVLLVLGLTSIMNSQAVDVASGAPSEQRPNVILLLLDDAGWADIGAFGGRMQTPQIDRLAAEGMRFTDCHSAAPNCSPSRAGILTGRIPARVGIYSYLPTNHPMHLRAEEITVAELAIKAGYRTGHFGKWHLSDLDNELQPGPLQQGFEYSLATSNNASPSHRNPVNFVRNGTAVGKIEGYSCQIVVDEALSWMNSIGVADDSADPFLACLWFHEPHTPIASPPELVQAYRQRYPELSQRDATYLANIENVDIAVGRLLNQLDEWAVAENTVIWFTSDNGPLSAFSKGELRGQKSHVWEGGHRVPGIVRWPGHVTAASECREPVSGIDFLPTFCELAGIDPPSDRIIDGVNLLPLWQQKAGDFQRPTPLYWFFYRLNPSLAIRDGDWSLVARTDDANRPKAHPLLREDIEHLKKSQPTQYELYHLGRDLGQKNDVSLQQSDQLNRMKSELNSLHREIMQQGVEWDIPAEYGATAGRRVWNSD